jgi:hypothetical protein
MAFGVSTASRMLCRDITGQGNSIAFWINACAWPKNFQRKGGRVAGSFWPVVWVARLTFLKWPAAFSRH